MVQIGKTYSLYFGKDIFIKYQITNIDWNDEWVELKILDDNLMYNKYEYIKLNYLKNKRKIMFYDYPSRCQVFNNLPFFQHTCYKF